MLKIRRVIESGTAIIMVSGRIGGGEVPDLLEVIRADQCPLVVLDLAEVSLVDAATVQFLVQCKAQGIRIVHCPAYIREWMTREEGEAES